MDDAFARSLAEWVAFYALMGAVAGTLIGLLFVAVSLRLDMFRRQEVADVRDFAIFNFGTFLAVIAISALALAPHQRQEAMAFALCLMGVIGLLGMAWVVRAFLALNRQQHAVGSPRLPNPLEDWSFIVFLGAAYVGLFAVAVLLWRGHDAALGWLAIVDAWLMGMGTIAAWIMLSHAKNAGDG